MAVRALCAPSPAGCARLPVWCRGVPRGCTGVYTGVYSTRAPQKSKKEQKRAEKCPNSPFETRNVEKTLFSALFALFWCPSWLTYTRVSPTGHKRPRVIRLQKTNPRTAPKCSSNAITGPYSGPALSLLEHLMVAFDWGGLVL